MAAGFEHERPTPVGTNFWFAFDITPKSSRPTWLHLIKNQTRRVHDLLARVFCIRMQSVFADRVAGILVDERAEITRVLIGVVIVSAEAHLPNRPSHMVWPVEDLSTIVPELFPVTSWIHRFKLPPTSNGRT